METITYKNRQREYYSFANINLLGTCNADCYFCLGKDILEVLMGKNQLDVYYPQWKNFFKFIDNCRKYGIKKVYFTGQMADGLQYKYLSDVIDFLQESGFLVGVRTNGYLANSKMDCIKKMKEEIGYSINSLTPKINEKIMGIRHLPNWDKIIPQSGDNVRVSIVLCKYNIDEIYDIVRYISKFENVRYIQIRRISTDTRQDLLKDEILLFERFYWNFIQNHEQTGTFCLAPTYELCGKEIIFWRTVQTSVNSLNYFTDGTCSDEYFIVEGYLKYKNTKKAFTAKHS